MFWHGYTRPANADAYEALLRDEIITGIEDRSIDGFREIQLFRRNLTDEVEFITVMWFDSLDAVRAFAGEDHEASVMPPAARELLARFDELSQHYEVRERGSSSEGWSLRPSWRLIAASSHWSAARSCRASKLPLVARAG
jgi:antibiotic biosynthesis monooxygenase (ABM) superfamily enzyme